MTVSREVRTFFSLFRDRFLGWLKVLRWPWLRSFHCKNLSSLKCYYDQKVTFLFYSSYFENTSSYYLPCQVSSQNSCGKSNYFNCDFRNWLAAITGRFHTRRRTNRLKGWSTYVNSRWLTPLISRQISHKPSLPLLVPFPHEGLVDHLFV